MHSNKISHSGVIDSIAGNNVKVRIVQSSACSGCKISAHCSSAESKEKIIDVFVADSGLYYVGQEVNVIASASVGLQAVLYGFALPTIILLLTIIACLKCISMPEAVSAIIGIGALVPYYLILYFLRNKMRKTLLFYIENKSK